MYSDFVIDKKLVLQGYYDIKTQCLLSALLNKGECYVDVGANVGAMTFAAASRIGDTGIIYAIEPGPVLFQMLSDTISKSKLSNVNLFNIGCSEEIGGLYWKMDDSNPGNAELTDQDTGVRVTVQRLDDLIPEHQIGNLIKIDVEGMELQILRGANRIINNSRPLLIIETNTDNEKNFNKTKQLLLYLELIDYMIYGVKNEELELINNEKFALKLMPVSFPSVPQNVLAVYKDSVNQFSKFITRD